jgi:OOP family OmpA-OmpF porin
VLLHSLVFRVEQVFLIHRQTGLLLCHVKAESVVFQDADLVSGMLTAIEDFVRDSFDASQWESLENLQIGELMVFIEHGPLAYLAAVVRGSAPADLSSRLKGTLEMIHLEFHQALESFDGNTGAFQTAAGRLEDCLQNSYRTEGKKVFPYFKVLSVALSATVAAWVLLEVRAGLRWKSYLERLRAEKGLVVVSWEKKDAKYVVTGLRDPLAADPASFVTASGLDPGRVVGRWELVQTMEPEFVLARARKTLDPPETVSLSLKDGVVTAEGSAGYQWIMDARRLARSLPGVREYQDDQLTVAYDAELEMIRKQLAPPETVSLSLKDAVLTARGSAPYRWIIDTRALARLLPGIQEYQDRELSIDYDSVLRRIKEELSPPNTVSLRIVDGVLWAAGSAPREWIAQAKRNLRGFPEISAYRDDQLRDQDKDRLEGLAAAISRMTLSYEKNMSRLAPGQETGLSDLVSSSLSLQALAGKLAVRFRIHVKGHTDSTGSEAENTRLSKKRAEEMAAHLASQGGRR